MTSTIFYIALAAIILVALYFLSTSFLRAQLKREKGGDAYANQQPNDTNYNIDTIDDEVIENATPEEAREILRKIEAGNMPSLSDDDFYKLKRKIEGKGI